jgi:hypothetical protein
MAGKQEILEEQSYGSAEGVVVMVGNALGILSDVNFYDNVQESSGETVTMGIIST